MLATIHVMTISDTETDMIKKTLYNETKKSF